jgi:hypothetical protein
MLHFAPMQLVHTKINKDGENCSALLLCGTDGVVHLYTEVSSEINILSNFYLYHFINLFL